MGVMSIPPEISTFYRKRTETLTFNDKSGADGIKKTVYKNNSQMISPSYSKDTLLLTVYYQF